MGLPNCWNELKFMLEVLPFLVRTFQGNYC